jgi:hypothetical protein
LDFLCNFFGVPNPACADVKDACFFFWEATTKACWNGT